MLLKQMTRFHAFHSQQQRKIKQLKNLKATEFVTNFWLPTSPFPCENVFEKKTKKKKNQRETPA